MFKRGLSTKLNDKPVDYFKSPPPIVMQESTYLFL